MKSSFLTKIILISAWIDNWGQDRVRLHGRDGVAQVVRFSQTFQNGFLFERSSGRFRQRKRALEVWAIQTKERKDGRRAGKLFIWNDFCYLKKVSNEVIIIKICLRIELLVVWFNDGNNVDFQQFYFKGSIFKQCLYFSKNT